MYKILIVDDEKGYTIVTQPDGTIVCEPYVKPSYEKGELKHKIIYGIISWAQALLIPLWVLFCVGLTGTVFYKRELEKSLKVLNEASKKIADNCLDFEIPNGVNNELGDLCQSFEHMRSALYENNKKTWRTLEERKQLNAAFAHDIRTPITILKGYTELLKKYDGTEQLSMQKKAEILELMGQQVERLENYAQKMSSVQKLEDIEIQRKMIPTRSIAEKCREMCRLMHPDLLNENEDNLDICIYENFQIEEVFVDEELVLEVFENLLTNALRYAKERIVVSLTSDESYFSVVLEDDGKGFSKEELSNAAKPFYCAKEEKEGNHFGLGLFICSTICQKSGGNLILANSDKGGGIVIANFSNK